MIVTFKIKISSLRAPDQMEMKNSLGFASVATDFRSKSLQRTTFIFKNKLL